MKNTNIYKALLGLLLLVSSSLVPAEDLTGSVILVAKREVRDQVYGSTVLIATPLPGGQHFGFILNRPTRFTLSKMFPDHGPSQKIIEPVYLGGPVNLDLIFALVQRAESPGGDSIELMPGLYVAFDGETVDRIIETSAEQARFVAGLVSWRPGELNDEIKRGLWHVLKPEAASVLRKPTDGLWEELVERAANGI